MTIALDPIKKAFIVHMAYLNNKIHRHGQVFELCKSFFKKSSYKAL